MRTPLISFVVAAAACLATPVAAAETYTIVGTGSGFLGAYEFNDAAFTFTLIGSDAHYTSGALSRIDPLDEVKVAIAGIGAGVLSVPTQLFLVDGAAGLSRATSSGADLFDMIIPTIGGLLQKFSVQSSQVFALNQFQNVATTAGDLTVNSSSNVTFAHDASAGAVPEPAAWTLMIAGFGLVGATLRRRSLVPA